MQMSINYTVTAAQLGQVDDKTEHAPQPSAWRRNKHSTQQHLLHFMQHIMLNIP